MPSSSKDGNQLSGPLSGELAAEQLTGMTVLLTSVGCIYRIARSPDGRWWRAVDDPLLLETPVVWEEVRAPDPWPPVVGCPVRLIAPRGRENGRLGRCKGAFCWTAPVEAVTGEAAQNGGKPGHREADHPPDRIAVETEPPK